MTYKVQITAGMRTSEIYSGPSSRYASLVYNGAIEALRFSGATATVQERCESHRELQYTATTPVIDGKSAGQSVYRPGWVGGVQEVRVTPPPPEDRQ